MAINQVSESQSSLQFPDTPAGRQARWYVEARSGKGITKAEVEEHFSPSFTSGWGSPHDDAVREQWVARWSQFKVVAEEVNDVSPFEVEITWRFPGGARQRNRFEVEEVAPHRILSFDNANREDIASTPGDFVILTDVTPEGDSYKAEVHPNLVTPMGPFGGYIAAIALRAAGVHTDKPKPLSFSCHFLNPGRIGPLEAKVKTLRSSSRLESMRVELVQDQKVLVEALVWGSTELQGSEHVLADIADVPKPDEVMNYQELFPGQPSGPFQQVVEGRPLLDGWQPPGDPPWYPDPQTPRPPAEARYRCWVRMLPPGPLGDAWVKAARTLVPFDWISVPTTVMPHRAQWIQTPSLDTTIAFHNLDSFTEWMLVQAESPIANAGFASATASIWSESGSLIAVGMQQVMHRVMNQNSVEG